MDTNTSIDRSGVDKRMIRRISGFDVARAFAVFGMVVVNFKVVMSADSGNEWLIYIAGLLDGRAAATFVILAGVGIVLLSKSINGSNCNSHPELYRNVLLKRALLLFVVGLSYSAVWPADILHFYGLYIAIGAFFITSSNRVIWSMSALFTLLFVMLLVFFDYEKGWDWKTLNYVDFWTVNGMIRHMFFNGFHPVFPWTAFLFTGIWLGRKNLFDSGKRNVILVVSLCVWIAAELVSAQCIDFFSGLVPAEDAADIKSLFGTDPIPPMPLYIISAGGQAVAFIIACVIVAEQFKNSAWMKPLVYTGQMSLTLYVAHVVIGMGFLESIGRLNSQSIEFALVSAVLFNILSVVFAVTIRSRFKTGPLEYLFRKFAGVKPRKK